MLGALLFLAFADRAFAFTGTSIGGPPDAQTGVPLDAFVNRQFDATLSGATVNTTNVTLKANTGNALNGAPTGSNLCTVTMLISNNMIVCEHAPLSVSTWYSFSIGTGVKSSTGVALASALKYQFQTTSFAGGAGFISPPSVLGSVPRPGLVLPINAKMRVYFGIGGSSTGTTMRTSTTGSILSPVNVQIFAATNGQPTNATNLLACATVGASASAPTDCNMSYSSTGSILTLTPGKKAPAGSVATTGTALTAGQQYVMIVKGAVAGVGGARNTENIPMMKDYYVTFTATGSDIVGPDVKSSFPQNAATGVDREVTIGIGFKEAVDPSTVSGSSVRLYLDNNSDGAVDGGDTLVTGTSVEYAADQGTAFLSPNTLLAATGAYVILVTSGIKDLAGNAFDSDPATGGNQNRVITFTTGSGINGGGGTDAAGPRLQYANADNSSIAVTFNEPVKFNVVANDKKSGSTGNYDVNNMSNWTLEAPSGSPVNLTGKSIQYLPSKMTLVIGNLSLPPNSTFKLKAVTSSGAAKIRDLSANTVDTTGSPPRSEATGTVKSVADTGGQVGPGGGGGSFDFGANGMNGSSPAVLMPMTPVAGKASTYQATIGVPTSIGTGGTINLTFPVGFSFTSSCSTALSTPDNADINGLSRGVVGIQSISCDNSSRTITITTSAAATVAGDRLRFQFQGINNSSVVATSSDPGYTVTILTKSPAGAALDSRTSMPFFLGQGGSLAISGTVFNDNGAGGGTANDGIKNGSEAGVASIQVCSMGGVTGSSCATTDVNGAYSFTSLSAGHYSVQMPPLTSGSFIAQQSMRDVNLVAASVTGINFGLTPTTSTITVSLSGIPASTALDVFAFNPMSTQGGNIMRLVTAGAATRTVTLPVPATGNFKVSVGPHMNTDPSAGASGMPVFTFVPPAPKDATPGSTVTFALAAASYGIKGHVRSADGTAIPNAFIIAKSATQSQIGNSQSDSFAQSQSDGSFSVSTVTGSYTVQAMLPGAAPSAPVAVTVIANVSNADNNASADIYKGTTLVTNAGANFATVNLDLLITKGGISIQGKVLDEQSNGIAYAHVQAKKLTSGSSNGLMFDAPTDSNGNYTIYVDASSSYSVVAYAPGYGLVGSSTVQLGTTSLSGQNIQASSSDFSTIAGTVTQSGSGVQGVFVNAFSSTGGGNSTSTAADGTYTLKVKAGTYNVQGFVPGQGPTSSISSLVVAGGVALTGKNLTIGSVGTITVTIAGITDAFVDARTSSGNGNGTSTNTTAGVYSLTVPAGTYTVRAQNPRLGLIGVQSATVTAGATKAITLTPPTTVLVSGTLASTSATCINSAGISFADKSNGRVSMTLSDANGNFSINLPSGTYAYSVGKPGCVDASTPGSAVVSSTAVSGLTRTLTPTDATITGTVTLDGSSTNLKTQVIGQTTDGKFVFTEANAGSFTLNVPSGTSWELIARADGYVSPAGFVSAGSSSAILALSAISGFTRKDPVSSSVTPTAGGIINNAQIGSNFAVNMPSGALGTSSNSATVTTSTTTAFVSETAAAKVVGSSAIEITPVDSDGNAISSLSSAATVTIPYSDADVTAAGVSDASKLSIATWNSTTNTWDSLATTVDTESKTLSAATTHFSTFAAVAANGGGTTSSSSTSTSTSTSTSGSSGGGGGGGAARRSAMASYQTQQKTAPAKAAANPASVSTPVKASAVAAPVQTKALQKRADALQKAIDRTKNVKAKKQLQKTLDRLKKAISSKKAR